MHFFVHIVLPYLLFYKYWAIFAVTFVAALAFPIPPGTLLMAASAFASQGYLSLPWIILVGTAGNVAGDTLGYLIARRYGKPLLSRAAFFRRLFASERYARFERRLADRPGPYLFISRFEALSNLSVNIIAGMSRVPLRKYILWVIPGELAQVGIYSTIGYLVGDNWEQVADMVSRYMLIALAVLAVLAALFWKRIWARLTRR